MLKDFYNCVIDIRRVSGSTTNNVYSETTSSLLTCSASQQPISGMENIVNNKKEAQVKYVFYIENKSIQENDILLVSGSNLEYDVFHIAKWQSNHDEVYVTLRK